MNTAQVLVELLKENGVEYIFGVPGDTTIGYPLASRKQSHPPKPNGRKPFDEVVFWERWGG